MADGRQIGTEIGRRAAAEVVAGRADLREDLLSASRVAAVLDGGGVTVDATAARRSAVSSRTVREAARIPASSFMMSRASGRS